MLKRTLLTSSALFGLAACSVLPGGKTSFDPAAINTQITAAINAVSMIGAMASVFVPSAAPLVASAEPYLAAANNVAKTIVATITAFQAQPIVTQIVTALRGAVTATEQVIAAIPNPQERARASTLLEQAAAVIDLLNAFATGVEVVLLPPRLGAVAGGSRIYTR